MHSQDPLPPSLMLSFHPVIRSLIRNLHVPVKAFHTFISRQLLNPKLTLFPSHYVASVETWSWPSAPDSGLNCRSSRMCSSMPTSPSYAVAHGVYAVCNNSAFGSFENTALVGNVSVPDE